MKQKIIIGLAIFIVSLIAQGVFAAELDSTLSFEILSENIEAYSLNFGNQDIIVGNILTKQLIFLNNQNNSGFFYLRNNNIRSFPQQFTFISPRINEIKYNLIHFESLSEFLTNEQLTAFGVEEQGFFSLVSELDSKSITINGTKIDALLLPDDGSKLITASNGNFGSKELPVNLKFKERNSSSENLQDVAGGEAEVQSGEIGCIDNDDVSSLTNLDLEENSPSFVSYIFKKNGELTSITIPDFCAESIIEQGRTLSKLYEAECSADGLPTYREVNCNCNNGACITENKIQRYCIDTDPLTYDVEEEEEEAIENEGIENRASGQIDIDKGSGKTPAEGFTITFGSKGTTMGYYAATEGKEFGLWEDYCADEKTLVEYYCTNDETTMFRTVICPKGCSNGKCIELPYCFETDGGKTIEYKGITKAVNSSESYHNLVDECVDRNTLKEYYCDKTSVLTGFNSENIACGEGKECNDGKCTNIETCITDDDCTDGQTCIGGVCAHGYVTACFIDQKCPQGYECTGEPGNIGQCVPIEEVELLKCSSCITERPYDVWVWEGETCAIDETKYEEEILSCQKGSYCVENDMLGPQCSVESLDTWEQIYGAFLRIQIWAKWLNTLIPPSIGVAQDDSSEGRVWQAGMNSVSQGLNSIDNAISAA
ncbi:MAG: hypothetical protein KKA65_05570, partial [Nanoarchaeota archaeon]|nr:hypothetical protein [Nanoarchaeota archaeon]MBU4456939.1 hypothetical protein [Nanoarchaeota archaeon]MCG2720081.1 hypothetical protein [Nanoarchaeota archaeon]